MRDAAVKLATLRERQAQIQARIAKLESVEKKQARKEETRLKILIGAGMLADTAHHKETQALIRLVLARAITSERDREFLKQKGWL